MSATPKIVIFGNYLRKMTKKHSRFNRFFKKISFKYRVSILNENTLEEPWHVRLSRFSVFLYTFAFILITFFLLTVLILFTPIRYFLPGYGDSGNRSQIIKEAVRADSLQNQIELHDEYLEILKSVISGNLSADSIPSIDSVESVKRTTTFLEKSKTEERFLKNFEDAEKYNLSVIDTKPKEDAYVFFRPVRGTIASAYNSQKNQYGIYFTSQSENVMSILAGTVIFARATFDSGWTVIIQHDNNFISVYKNATNIFKKAGDKVKAGEAIASVGSGKPNQLEEQFYFELWKDGQAVNPEEYIIF